MFEICGPTYSVCDVVSLDEYTEKFTALSDLTEHLMMFILDKIQSYRTQPYYYLVWYRVNGLGPLLVLGTLTDIVRNKFFIGLLKVAFSFPNNGVISYGA